MINRIIEFSATNKTIVFLVTAAAALLSQPSQFAGVK
jgi:hypothetical protein